MYWIGASDRRLELFENVYPIPKGVSYNSYVILDEKTVLLDTVDRSVCDQFIENLEYVLEGRDLDYVIINHMEPDHCASLAEVGAPPSGSEDCGKRENIYHDETVLYF